MPKHMNCGYPDVSCFATDECVVDYYIVIWFFRISALLDQRHVTANYTSTSSCSHASQPAVSATIIFLHYQYESRQGIKVILF